MSPRTMPFPGFAHIRRHQPRTGSILKIGLAALVVVAMISVVVWFVAQGGGDDEAIAVVPTEVTRGPYEHVVIEQGEVESSKNIEIRCEVKSRTSGNSPSTTILDIVPEGTQVKKDDWLITFDSSAMEDEKSRQQIVVNNSETLVIQAEATYKTAQKALEEYLNGTFVQEEKTILNEIYVAEDALKKAQLDLRSAERLLARGLLTDLQLEAHRFAVQKAQNELDLANTKLNVLRDITKEKQRIQLESDIHAAKVKWDNELKSHDEELKNLAQIEEQIAKCQVFAPEDGTVVYANVTSSRSQSEFVVEPGAAVRERQVIIRLPDPKHMQVAAKINEARINLVKPGMPVSIRIDAFGDELLRGEVSKVNKYAEAGNWWSSTAKQYATYITIVDPPPTLRSGLTAEVRIHVENRDNVLQMPVQAVYENKGRTFVLVKNGDKFETRKITIASTNDKQVAIDEADSEPLKEGDVVVMNPRDHDEKFDLSKYPEPKRSPVGTARLDVNTQLDLGSAETLPAGNASGDSQVARSTDAGGSGGGGAGGSPAEFFQRLDQDADGKISSDELSAMPGGFGERMAAADSDGDGSIDRTEFMAQMAKMRAAREAGGFGGPSGGAP